MSAHCRIGRVSYKAHNVVSIHSPPVDDLRQKMIADARDAADTAPEEALLGFVIVAWTEGARCVHYGMAREWMVNPFVLPEIARDALSSTVHEDSK
jgi:hypothetical protein